MPFGDPRDRGIEDKVGVLEDMARSVPTGLTEGISYMAGTLGDLGGLARTGVDAAAKFAAKQGFGDGKAPPTIIPSPGQVLNVLATAGAKKAGVDPKAARLAMALMNPMAAVEGGGSKEAQAALTKDKPLYQPQTKAGKYARTVSQFAPAAAMPGSAGRRLASVIAPGVLSEAAGQATEGSSIEPLARTAGALVGGGLASVVGRPGPDTRILAEATRGASDEQIAAARQLMETAEAQGVRLTMAEAMQQVTNGATGMSRMQRVLEGTRAGNERIAPVMAERPQQVRQAVTEFADSIAPPAQSPSMVGAEAQAAAGAGLNDVRQFVNWGARPHYEALQGQSIPNAEYLQLRSDPTYAAALAELRSTPELNQLIAHLPDNDLGVINEVMKRIQGMAEAARPNPANPISNHQLESVRNAAANRVDELASAASDDWRAARDGVAAGRQEYLEPLQRGPLGAISGTDNVKAQTTALFPNQPLEGAPAETAHALEMLATRNPEAAAGLTRQHLVSALNEATQDNLGGPNQWGGAKYAAQIAGNPEQQRVLQAGVEAVGGDRGQLDALIEVLRATGRRERPGSMTAYNNRDLEELGKAGAMGEIARTGLNAPGVFRRLGQGFQDWQTERNAGRLAEAILANPEEAERIVLHAREVVPPGQALQTIEQLAIAASQSRQQQPQLEAR